MNHDEVPYSPLPVLPQHAVFSVEIPFDEDDTFFSDLFDVLLEQHELHTAHDPALAAWENEGGALL